MRQLTMFEMIRSEYPDFKGMSEPEIVCYIGDALGLDFKPDGRKDANYGYCAKFGKKIEFDVRMLTYKMKEREGEPFIAVDYFDRNDWSGASIGCDSIKEAIEFFRRVIDRYSQTDKDKV